MKHRSTLLALLNNKQTNKQKVKEMSRHIKTQMEGLGTTTGVAPTSTLISLYTCSEAFRMDDISQEL